MKPLPLTWRVSLLVTLVLAGVIAAISVAAYLELREALRQSFDEGLLVVAKGISGEMDEPQGAAQLQAEIHRFVRPSAHLRSVEYRVWEDGQAEDLAASPEAESRAEMAAIPEAKRPEPGSTRFLSTGGRDGPRRMVWMRRATLRGTANVVVSASEGYIRHEMSEFLGVLLGIGGVMGLGAAAVAMLIVVWGLRPIGRTAAVLAGITHRTLGREPLDALNAPRELRPFISTLSQMLARLNRGILQQQQFTADASHELRTPLAVAKSTLQAVRSRDREAAEYRRAVDETLGDLERMERLINQLLVLTRMDETEGLADVADVPLDALLVQLAAKHDARAGRAAAAWWPSRCRRCSCAATRTCWPGCSATCWTTPSRMGRKGERSASGWSRWMGRTVRCRSTTRAAASLRRPSPASSTASIGRTPRAPGRPAAPAWAWPSPARLRGGTGATSRSRRPPIRGRAFVVRLPRV